MEMGLTFSASIGASGGVFGFFFSCIAMFDGG
jgi:hypothetical protein